MTIKIYNTLSGRKEEFQSQKKNFVSMYVCGVTPYDEVHLGHARAYVVFDTIKRHLLIRGYQVKHIQNFTDVDDKIIKRSQERNIRPSDLVQFYIDDYFIQTNKLNILKAEMYPRVTQMIVQIINFIKNLVDKGFAYEIDGNVYFSTEKNKDYGKLSKRNIYDLKSESRLVVCDGKKSLLDFVLWKKTKKNEPKEVSWASPWGDGRPGWHIECSVMSSELLGDTIDIHGGGQDLIFPHHENEIAQSEAKTTKQFVNYWIHNGFVTVNQEKISKSSSNFFTLGTIFKRYNPCVVRYYLLTQHYSSPLDFSDKNLKVAENTLQGIYDAYLRLVASVKESAVKIIDKDLLDLQKSFLGELDDDFSFEKALSHLHKLKNIILNELLIMSKARLAQLRKLFENFTEDSLGILLPKEQSDDVILQNILNKRNEARKNQNWIESDNLRKLINEKGYKIIDNEDNTAVLIKKI